MNRKLSFAVSMLLLIHSPGWSSWAQPEEGTRWKDKFEQLVPGLSRLETEKEIAKVRDITSTYDLYAMDTSALVAYSLDQHTILLVRYKPGFPAPRVIDKSGKNAHLVPIDGSLIEYQVLELR